MSVRLVKTVVGIEQADVMRRRVLAVFQTTAQAIWWFLMIVAVLTKTSILSYVSHFTNWSWTLQIFFYGFTLPSACIIVGFLNPDSFLGKTTQFVIVALFFPLWGIVSTVLLVVWVLLGTDAEFLADILATMPTGIVFIGNDVFHFLPVFSLVIFYLFYHKLVHYSINHVIARYGILDNPGKLFVFIIYQAYSPLLLLALYALIFDPRVIYSTDLSILAGIVVVILALSFFSLGALLVMLALLGVGSRNPYSKAWLWRNDSDQDMGGGVVLLQYD